MGINLSQEELQKRRELTNKLAHKTIKTDEATTLKKILEKEKGIATQNNDLVALIAIFGLIAAIAYILSRD